MSYPESSPLLISPLVRIIFVRGIRGKYPAAHIICMLGNMDITKEGSVWPEYVQKVVDGLEDPKIYKLFVPYENIKTHMFAYVTQLVTAI